MYNRRKEDEAILYLAQRLETAYPRKVLDVLYLAEKLHLSRYGRTITGGQWWAGSDGAWPMPWRYRERQESESNYSLVRLDQQPGNGTHSPYCIWPYAAIRPLREPDGREFSQTDEECLDEVIGLSLERDDEETWKEARDWAWQQAVDELVTGHYAPMPLLTIALTLPNAREVIRLLYQEGWLPQVVLGE